jgi:hypothetical protein
MFTVGSKTFDVHPLSKFSTIYIKHPKVKGVELLDLRRITKMSSYFFTDYSYKYIIGKGSLRGVKSSHYLSLDLNSVFNVRNNRLYVQEKGQNISGVMKSYLRSLCKDRWDERYIIMKQRNTIVQ